MSVNIRNYLNFKTKNFQILQPRTICYDKINTGCHTLQKEQTAARPRWGTPGTPGLEGKEAAGSLTNFLLQCGVLAQISAKGKITHAREEE